MKNTAQNEFFSYPYRFGNIQTSSQRNVIAKKDVLKSREDFPRIEQRTLRQATPVSAFTTKETTLNLRRPTSHLTAQHKQQFYKTLQDNAEFIQEFKSLNQFYKFYELNSIKTFLRKNRFLIPLLREMPEKIYRYFGKGQELALKVSFEYDFPQSSELRVLILTKISANEAFPILENFDEEWWLENIARTDGKLNISLEYI